MNDTEYYALCDKTTPFLEAVKSDCVTALAHNNEGLVHLTGRGTLWYGDHRCWHYACNAAGNVYMLEPLSGHNGTSADCNRRNWPRDRDFKAALKQAGL